MTSRIDFFKLAKKLNDEAKNHIQKWDKMVIFGTYNKVIYNRIILIKYI